MAATLGGSRQQTRRIFGWLQEHRAEYRLALLFVALFPCRRLCEDVGVSRSGFYEFLRRSKEENPEETEIRKHLHRIVGEFTGYGYRRPFLPVRSVVSHALRREGIRVNHKRVLRLMREEKLLCQRGRRKRRTTDSSHDLPAIRTRRKRRL